MPLRLGSVGLFFSLVAIAYAGRYAADGEMPARAARGPASVTQMHKEETLGPLKTVNIIRHTEKLRGPLTVRLEMLGPKPEIGETFVMRGTITSRKALDAANFQWHVPPGLELVNGQISGTVGHVSNDQPAVVELTLRKLSSDNAQVHLMASATLADSRFGDSTQYNTEVQNLLSTTKATSLEKSGAANAGAPAKAPPIKIFH